MRWVVWLLMFIPGVSLAQADGLVESRKRFLAQLLLDPRSPIDSVSIHDVAFFAPNDTFVCETVILPLLDTATVAFPTSDGATKDYRPYARLFFRHGSAMHGLTVYESLQTRNHPLYRNKLFLPFLDDTNGFESYGGGRYLDVDRRDVEAREVTLDFNRAYNPWCAYSDDFSCPIPPPTNRLPFRVQAGEAAFAKTHDTSPPSHVAPAERDSGR